jgi:putative SOS response-associated peptidase YedK
MNPVGETTFSCAVITMPANELMARIHNSQRRMPAILAKEDIDAWLNGTVAQAKALLKQFPDERMKAWAVSRRVNSPRENGPDLIQPLEPES